MSFSRGLAAVALVVAAACSSSTSGSGGQPGPNQVFMQNSAFNPATRTVAAGTTVTWVNQDGITHTVTYSSGVGSPFDSGSIAGGSSYSLTFNSPGTVQYYCKIHGSPGAGMHGTIVIQ